MEKTGRKSNEDCQFYRVSCWKNQRLHCNPIDQSSPIEALESTSPKLKKKELEKKVCRREENEAWQECATEKIWQNNVLFA